LTVTEPQGIQTVVLCGRKGIRLREYTEPIPKVLVEVGARPILWHIMKGYAEHGFCVVGVVAVALCSGAGSVVSGSMGATAAAIAFALTIPRRRSVCSA
jgi:dTDP-glucose pyrophosphorylase